MITFIRRFIFALTLTIAVLPFTGHAKLNLVQQVDEGVWRGSQPTNSTDFDQLEKMGIKVIINIQRAGDKKVAIEKKKALARGFQFIHIPMDANETPSDESIEKIFKELLNAKSHPVFLHCTLGRDRTGLVFALYRVRVQGQSPEEAYKEWTGMGFINKYLKKLDRYFKDQTGFSESAESFAGPCETAINF